MNKVFFNPKTNTQVHVEIATMSNHWITYPHLTFSDGPDKGTMQYNMTVTSNKTDEFNTNVTVTYFD